MFSRKMGEGKKRNEIGEKSRLRSSQGDGTTTCSLRAIASYIAGRRLNKREVTVGVKITAKERIFNFAKEAEAKV